MLYYDANQNPPCSDLPQAMISRLHIRLSVFLIAGVNAQTNLPDVSPGVFNISTRIVIGTNTAAVWETLLDFPKYPDWNPFVR